MFSNYPFCWFDFRSHFWITHIMDLFQRKKSKNVRYESIWKDSSMNPTTLDFLLSLQFWCKQCWFLNFGPVWLTSLHFILMKIDFISLKLDHTICMIYSTCNNARLILLTTFASLFIFMELIRSCTKNGLPSRDWNPRLYYGFSSV